jgi:hypothetical protein
LSGKNGCSSYGLLTAGNISSQPLIAMKGNQVHEYDSVETF